MSLDYQYIGKRIRMARKSRHLSQERLAELIGKTPGFLSAIESSKRKPSLETVVDVATVLDVTTDSLLVQSLHRRSQQYAEELVEMLDDCTDFEQRVLTDAFRNLKIILKANRHVPNSHRD